MVYMNEWRIPFAISERHFVKTGRFRFPLSRDRFLLPSSLPHGLLPLSVGQNVFKRTDVIRPVFAKPLAIQVGDENREWGLPWFLPVIGKAAKLPGIEAQFTRHLDVGVREMKPFSGLHPRLIF